MDKPEGCYHSLICHSPFRLILVACLAITLFLCFGFSPLLVVSIPVLLLSTIFIASFSNRNVVKEEEGAEVEVVEKLNQELLECVDGKKSEACELVHEYQVEPTEFPSDGESSDDSPRNDGFELNWKMMSLSNVTTQSLDDDGDDNLIEINLPPTDSSVHANNIVSKEKLSRGMRPGFWTEFNIIREEDDVEEEDEGIMELLEQMEEANEEDNLIEIDLSIGSIKYSNLDMED